MSDRPSQMRRPAVRAMTQAIIGARDPQIMRIVALVDAMMLRGTADLLIEPLRKRLATLRPPRPLRFGRLMFHPLDLLIVPAAFWRPGQQAIPRTALMPMCEHVRLMMGPAARETSADIAGHTVADSDLISRLGQSLWPAAAAILTGAAIPDDWTATGLGDVNYRPLADIVACLLAEAATLDMLCSEAATGVLPPAPEAIEAILSRVARANGSALPMMIALMLDRLPEVADLMPAANGGAEAAAVHAAMGDATELLLQQLDQDNSAVTSVATGTLAAAGAGVGRAAALLKYLHTANPKPAARSRLQALRRRLETDCKARFASGLEEELLVPLHQLGLQSSAADISRLEATARGLRGLETAGRLVGGGATYDLLLGKAAEAIKDRGMRDRLSPVDQRRLVEILAGSDAALAMFDKPP